MPLVWILHTFIGATLSGVGIVIALVAGVSSLIALIGIAAIGFIAAIPVSYIIAKRLGG